MKSIFPESMLSSSGGELTMESVAAKFDYFFQQIHLCHLQTSSYAEHNALNIWEDMPDYKDSFLEKLSGYLSRKVRAYKTQPISDNVLGASIITELKNYAKELKSYGEMNGFGDIVNMSDELEGKAVKVLYLLTLS